MANSDYGAAVAGAATQALGQYAVGVAQNKRQWKYQKEAMALQQEYNKQIWDYQNAYNTPQMQMERLKAAGLNPHLIYGSGSASAGNAGPMQSTEVPVRKATGLEVPDVMMRALTIRQMDAQYEATRQSTEVLRTRAGLNEIQTALGLLKQMEQQARSKNFESLALSEERVKRFVAHRAKELHYNERSKGALMDQLQEVRGKQMTGIELDNTFKQYRNQLAKIGVYSSDNPLLRLLIQGANRMGVDLQEILSNKAEDILRWLK